MPRLGSRGMALVLAAGLGLVGCAGHPYAVEQREVPVHVWLTAPDLATSGGSVPALVYVGAKKVVEGPVRVEAGSPTVALPTAYVRAGVVPVSAVLEGGALSASQDLKIAGESWVQILVRGRAVTLRLSPNQPDPRGR